MCKRSVQRADDWIKCHPWGGSRSSIGAVSASTYEPKERAGDQDGSQRSRPHRLIERGKTTAFERPKGVSVMSLNRATVIGYLGGDPVLRNLPSGQAAVGFSVATDESFTDKQGQKQQRVEWHQIVAFGKLAETCSQYLKKGRQIYVEGQL